MTKRQERAVAWLTILTRYGWGPRAWWAWLATCRKLTPEPWTHPDRTLGCCTRGRFHPGPHWDFMRSIGWRRG